MGSARPLNPPTGEMQDYLAALGRFVREFTHAAKFTHAMLAKYAGIPINIDKPCARRPINEALTKALAELCKMAMC